MHGCKSISTGVSVYSWDIVKKWVSGVCLLLICGTTIPLQAQSSAINQQGTIVDIKVEGLRLIEKGLILSTIKSQQGATISPVVVAEDIKSLYNLGYFRDVSVETETIMLNRIVLIFKVVEKPRIATIDIKGNDLFTKEDLVKKLKVYKNNMINVGKIKADVNILLDEYRKKGHIQTQVIYQINKIDNESVGLVYQIIESPKVFLTDIKIHGTKVYPPMDIERLMQSSEIDCFSWMNDSGVFQEMKINQDLQILTQHYLKNGYIKIRIDKPKVVLRYNDDYSKISVDLTIHEGEQYFIGEVNIKSADGNGFLFDKEEMLKSMVLQKGNVFNPFKQNEDRYKINGQYQEQGYAFAKVRVSNKINEESKTVDINFSIIRGEKAYIGRIEIQGNYETMDSVIRKELNIFDNELYNGLKIRQSQQNITRLGFFKQGMGVQMRQKTGNEENTLDYNILLEEAQTGSFNASLNYSGYSGLAVTLSISKKNFLGTGRTLTFSTEQQNDGDSVYNFSMVNPYWFDTEFINSFRIFSTYETETDYYDTRTNGFNFGLTYPIWKDWSAYSTYSWKDENYSDITSIGEESLDGVAANTYRSLRLGAKYSTVNNPMFPTDGYDLSASTEQFGGGVLGGSIEYRTYSINTRYFQTLNDSGTLVFGAKFNWSQYEMTNSAKDVPVHLRYTLGGITTVRGFEYGAIEGPSSTAELPDDFSISELYPYQGDYSDCQSDAVCPSLSTEKDGTRIYYEQHQGGIVKRVLNLQLYFPLTREGGNIRGLVFFDMGNVWAEDRMYEITGAEKDDWYYRYSVGTGINLITPMGVLRFEYGVKLNKKENEPDSKFDFHISGLF